MDTKTFLRIESTLKQARLLLAQDSELGQLLVLEDPYETGVSLPSVEQVKSHIFLQPVVNVENTPPYNKKCFLNLVVAESNLPENSTTHSIILRVNLLLQKDFWVCSNDNIRALRIIERIVAILNGKKLACASPLFFDSITESVTNSYIFGYVMLFNVGDGVGDETGNI